MKVDNIFPLKLSMVMATGSFVHGATIVDGGMYRGLTEAFAAFDLRGDIGLNGRSMQGSAEVMAVLSPGCLVINTVQATLNSATWSGSGVFVNPSTLQSVNVGLEIVTDPTTFSIMTTQALSLSANSTGGLEWERSNPPAILGDISILSFSGSYTLTGPTETVTGTFSHMVGSWQAISDGLLEPTNFPEEIELSGSISTMFPDSFRSNDLVLVDDVVDGIAIDVSTFGVRSGMGATFGDRFSDESTTFYLVPEPTTSFFVALASTTFLRRKRSRRA